MGTHEQVYEQEIQLKNKIIEQIKSQVADLAEQLEQKNQL